MRRLGNQSGDVSFKSDVLCELHYFKVNVILYVLFAPAPVATIFVETIFVETIFVEK